MELIDKDAVVTEIDRRIKVLQNHPYENHKAICYLDSLKQSLNTLEVKEVDLMIHTVIAEGCDWLALHTELSHEQIEDFRNLMLTIKDGQLKAQKGE